MARKKNIPIKTPQLCFHKNVKQYYVTLNKQRQYLGGDRAEAETKYRILISEWIGRGCQPPPPDAEDLTLAELCSRYLEYCKVFYELAPGNTTRVKTALTELLSLADGNMPVSSFKPSLLKAIRERMIGRDLARSYINQTVRVLVRMFRWSVVESLVEPDVYHRLQALEGLRLGFTKAREGRRRQGITLEELEAVRPYLSHVVMAALEIMYLTGSRPSEVLSLTAGDIDRSGDVWKVDLETHKTAKLGKRRTLFFGPKAQSILAPFLLRPADAYLFSPKEANEEVLARRRAARVTPENYGNRPGTNRKDDPEVQPGDRYCHKIFRRSVTRAIQRCNRDREAQGLPAIRHFIPYEARHGAATRIREQASLDGVQAVLGHSKIDMSQHYASLSEELAREIMRRMG